MKNKRFKQTKTYRQTPTWAAHYLPYQAILEEDFMGQKATEFMASIMAIMQNRGAITVPPQAPRVLIGGPSSSGKTTLVNLIRRHLNLESVTINGSLITPPGYRGGDLSTNLRPLAFSLRNRTANTMSAIHLEEADKLLFTRKKADEWTSSIQLGFLPLLNGEDIIIEDPENEAPTIFNSFNTAVFMTGVFSEIPKEEWQTPTLIRQSLLKNGLAPEFVSRITHFLYLEPLSEKEVLSLVEKESKLLSQLFQTGRDLSGAITLSPKEIKKIASLSRQSPLGLRGAKVDIFHLLQQKAIASARDNLFR